LPIQKDFKIKKFKNLLVFLIVFFISSVFALGKDEYKWREIKSRHFIIYYQDAPEGFIDKIKERAEEYYREIATSLSFGFLEQWTWENRCSIYIYPSQEEYIKKTGQPEWSSGVAEYDSKTIKSYPLASGFIDTLLPHELTHIIFREYIGKNNTIPTWFHEGLATYQELARRWGSKKMVQDAIKENRFITISQLFNTSLFRGADRETVGLFYAESSNLVAFLIERFGKEKFKSLCEDLKNGSSFEDAFLDNYPYKSFKEFEKAWLLYLK
jgi:hypothetical protein